MTEEIYTDANTSDLEKFFPHLRLHLIQTPFPGETAGSYIIAI